MKSMMLLVVVAMVSFFAGCGEPPPPVDNAYLRGDFVHADVDEPNPYVLYSPDSDYGETIQVGEDKVPSNEDAQAFIMVLFLNKDLASFTPGQYDYRNSIVKGQPDIIARVCLYNGNDYYSFDKTASDVVLNVQEIDGQRHFDVETHVISDGVDHISQSAFFQ